MYEKVLKSELLTKGLNLYTPIYELVDTNLWLVNFLDVGQHVQIPNETPGSKISSKVRESKVRSLKKAVELLYYLFGHNFDQSFVYGSDTVSSLFQ